jgi:hypothetical protein
MGGHTARIRSPYGFWHENRGILGTIFEAHFKIFVLVSGLYEIVRTAHHGHKKRGTEEVVQQYGFGTENEAYFCGTNLVLRHFPWLEMWFCCCFVLSRS